MRIRPNDARESQPPRHSDPISVRHAVASAYDYAIDGLHRLARELEALDDELGVEHFAMAARKDGDHYTELREQAKHAVDDAQRLLHRCDRNLRVIAKAEAANDS